MAGFGLRKNMVFDWSGARFRIDGLQSNGDVLLERVGDGCVSIVQQEKLLAEYREGNISATARMHDSVPSTENVFSRPLDELPQTVQQEAARRRHYLQAIFVHGRPIFTKDYLQPLILSAAAEIGDEKPPCATSIYRWLWRYRQNEDTRALIPRFDRRGSRNVKQSDKLLQLATEAIEEAFRASPHATCPSIYTRLVAKIEVENRALRTSD